MSPVKKVGVHPRLLLLLVSLGGGSALAVAQNGCSRTGPDRSRPGGPASAESTATGGEATVELSPHQLGSITIDSVRTYPFSVEREAVGSIGFDEDLPVVQAEATLLAAAATFEATTAELGRAKALNAANGGVSQRELEQATSDQEAAQGALTAARDAVRAFGKTDADIDRIIAARAIEPGLTSQADPSPSSKWALANVVESDVPLLRIGQPVELSVTAYPGRVFRGKVSKIYAVVDPDTHRGKIRTELADPRNELRPGMLANFVIRVEAPVQSVAIPVDAAVREGDGSMTVWVTSDRRHFVHRPVRLGLQADGRYQVLEGLRPGELVVTEGGVFLSNILQAPPTE